MFAAQDRTQIDIEDRIAKDDEHWLIAERFFCQIYGMSQPFADRLLDELDIEVVVAPHILLDHLAHVANDDRCSVDPLFKKLIEDMSQDGLACNVEQDFGECMGMWPETCTDPGYRDNCAH